jgi:hypothetical protein
VHDDSLESFRERTRKKLRHLVCPIHQRAPELVFEGASLRDVRIVLRSCCDRLSRQANRAIASLEPAEPVRH